MARTGEIIVGLDVGTTKVVAAVGEVREDHSVDIIGVGMSPSHGIKKGVVVDVGETMDAIRRAVHEAELMAGCTVKAVYVGISGGHLRSFNNLGVVAVQGQEVSAIDVDRVVENARAVQIPADRQILHTVPQEFVVDENDGIKSPVGIRGSRLQANVHIVTALDSGVQNVRQCAERSDLHVLKCYAELLASATAVLEPDEKELGVALVDIGGGTTDIAVYHNGSMVHSAVLPIGGDHITHDIAQGMRTSRAEAERIKLRHGCALSARIAEDETFDVASVGGREATTRKRTLLCDIIELRLEEIFNHISQELIASNFADLLASGVVLTGGTAQLPFVADLGEDILNLPVRIGRPKPTGGLYELVRSPSYAAAVGLLLLGAREGEQRRLTTEASGKPRLFTRLRDLLRTTFD